MKRILSMMLAILIITTMFVLPASAEGKKSGLFTYEIKGNGTAIITDFDWAANGNADIYIPRMLDGYTVTEIGELAFSDEDVSIEEPCGQPVVVIIPDTVTIIGKKAFFCSQITTANIPSSVQLIEGGAFAGCINIKQFTVDESNAVYATIDGNLYNKVRKELVAHPIAENEGLSVPDGITSIGAYACYGLDLSKEYNTERHSAKDVGIADTVTSIGEYAFAGFKRSAEYHDTFLLPSSLVEIGDYAFHDAVLYRVAFNDGIKSIGKFAFYESLITTSEGYGLLYAKELTFPASVEEIGEGAFACLDRTATPYSVVDMSTTQIRTLEPKVLFNIDAFDILLPDTLQVIGDGALKYAGGVTEGQYNKQSQWIIPASVERIEASAFYGAISHINFADGSSIEYIGDEAFACLEWQDTMTLPDGLLELGNRVFADTVDLTTLIIPNSVTAIGNDICNRANVTLQIEAGSYAAIYAAENGYITKKAGGDDTSWLNG